MVCLNTDRRVPSSADERLDELADILARAMLRMGTKKSGSSRDNRLELPAKTRLSVTTSEARNDCEVT
ncbi:MAG: hypothetical protein J7M14_03395 [Planctomycetes bacterium]|nr:hypothetical protein [Planctomycetota bacterium]